MGTDDQLPAGRQEAEAVTIDMLPSDLLWEIYKHIPDEAQATGIRPRLVGRRAFVEVSRSFRDAVVACASRALTDSQILTKNTLAEVSKVLPTMTSLRDVACTNCTLDDEVLATLAKLGLRTLVLNGSQFSGVSPAGYQVMQSFGALESLELSVCEIGNAALDLICSTCTDLKHLVVEDNPGITDVGLASLSSLSSLESLSVSDCERITDVGIDHIVSAAPHLTSLLLGGCDRITLAAASSIGKLTDLRVLDLSACFQLPPQAASHLASLTNLEDLCLSECPALVTDDTMADLIPTLTALTRLMLEYCEVGGQGLQGLSALTRLKEVSFCDSPWVSDTVMEALAPCTAIERLLLAGTLVSEQGLCAMRGYPFADMVEGLPPNSVIRQLAGKPVLQELDLSDCSNLNHEVARSLIGLTSLKKLHLVGSIVHSSGCQAISDLPLEELDLTGCPEIDNDAIAGLTKLTQLTSLRLAHCKRLTLMAYLGPALTALQVLSLSGIERVDDLCMRTIVKHCQDLRDVDVSETSISDKSLLDLSELPRLKALIVSHCHNIVGTGVPSLQALNGTLTDLDMGGCTRIQDSSLNAICRIGTLTSLTLEGCRNLTNVAIQNLSKLTLLQRLDLSECHLLNDVGMQALRYLSRVDQLRIRGAERVRKAGLECITHLKSTLTDLDLSWCKINDRSLATLSGLTALEKLDIGETAVKGWGLTHLKRLGRLQELTLANCMKLQDEWVGHVRELTSLQKIALDGCTQLTDAGVAGLVDLPNLRDVDLRACEKITNEALTALEEAGIVVHHPNEVDEGDEVPVLPDDHVVSSGEDWESDEEYDDDYLDYDDYYDSMYGVD